LNPTDEQWLAGALAEVGAIAGSVHRRHGARLTLTAAVGIPPPVIERTLEIPRGKGMAGLAWSRKVPVSTCDLVNDPSDDVRPGARAVEAGQAAAIPVLDADRVRAVVGFAFAESGQLLRERLQALSSIADRLPGG